MKKIELTFKNYISNEEVKIGDIFHERYEIISEPKITKNGCEWKIRHQKWMVGNDCSGGVILRMIRPDPSVYLAMDESEQSRIVTEYQRYFIPMQLHPFIEAFYDVRHIGGSAALFTEWSNRGTLAECMENGSLYRTENLKIIECYVVMDRLLSVAEQIAQALLFLEGLGIWYGEVNADNIMLNAAGHGNSITAKLSVANLLTKRRQIPECSDRLQWAETMLDMLVGQKRCRELYDTIGPEEEAIAKTLATVIADVQSGKLTDWNDILTGLGAEPENDYYITNGGSLTKYAGYLNNFALRLVDAGKKDEALRVLEEARGGEQEYYFGIAAIADKNIRKLRTGWEIPLKLYRPEDSYDESPVYMEDMMDAYFDLS